MHVREVLNFLAMLIISLYLQSAVMTFRRNKVFRVRVFGLDVSLNFDLFTWKFNPFLSRAL